VQRVEEDRNCMIETPCAICGAGPEETEVYRASLGSDSATYGRFSARRTPDRVHYRIVQCRECGLLRSSPILPEGELARLYAGSRVTYGSEAQYVGLTYAGYLREILPLLGTRDRLLEIGCGHGFFLERALDLGFSEVNGVEPSRHAVEIASGRVRGSIRNDVFREGLFPAAHFDVVCAFQVFDHMAHPNEVLQECRRILRPNGLALFINHDAGAWTNRLLGERSPIVDVEHIYLYNRETMRRLFVKHGFDVLRVFPVENRYPLHYWWQMAPLPGGGKRGTLRYLRQSRMGNWTLSWKAGNLGLVARQPQLQDVQ